MQLRVLLGLLSGVIAMTSASAADLNLSHYRRLPDCGQPVALANGDFAGGAAEWPPGDGWSLAPTGGRNGSAALHNERTDRESYVLCSRHLNLEPGATYRFGVWVRTEGVDVTPGMAASEAGRLVLRARSDAWGAKVAKLLVGRQGQPSDLRPIGASGRGNRAGCA
jgi:hypothetical protein